MKTTIYIFLTVLLTACVNETVEVENTESISSSSSIRQTVDFTKIANDTLSSSVNNISTEANLSSEIIVSSLISSSSVALSLIQMSSSSEILLFSSIVVSSSLEASSSSYLCKDPSVDGKMTDCRDERIYKTVDIGTQTWMAENLNFGEFQKAQKEGLRYQWKDHKFCYGDLESRCDSDGALYQWHTAMNLGQECVEGVMLCSDQINSGLHQGVCPEGWHVPNTKDWEILLNGLGDNEVASSKMKLQNTGFMGWDRVEVNDGNSSGFSGYPSGLWRVDEGFGGIGNTLIFWIPDNSTWEMAGYYVLTTSDIFSGIIIKTNAKSIRCLKD